MPPPPVSSPSAPWHAARDACEALPPALDALVSLYRELERSRPPGRPRCLGGGACCRFDLAGHRLYASTLELALLTTAPMADASRCGRGRCPYQLGPRCTARERRPLGCRLYFCGPGEATLDAESWHGRVRDLHDRFQLTYVYQELTGALGSAPAANPMVLR